MDYLIHISVYICTGIIIALGLNLIVGYTGLLSLAHAAFVGIGSYAFAILIKDYNVNFFVAQLLGVVIAMGVAGVIGTVLSKFRGDYYALCSLGFTIIVFGFLLNAQSITRGPLGIAGVPRPVIFGATVATPGQFLVFALVYVVLSYFFCRFIVRSSFGRVLKAIREDEEAVQVFGYRTRHYKYMIFMIGAGLAALGATLYTSYLTFIDPSGASIHESVYYISAIILGGLASLPGSIVGAVLMQILPELLRFAGFPTEVAAQLRLLIYGLLLVLLMRFRPRGILGEYKL